MGDASAIPTFILIGFHSPNQRLQSDKEPRMLGLTELRDRKRSRIENLIDRRKGRPAHHNKEIRDSLPLGDRIEKEQPIQFNKAGRIRGQGWIPLIHWKKATISFYQGQGFDSLLAFPRDRTLYQRVKERLHRTPCFDLPFCFSTNRLPLTRGWLHQLKLVGSPLTCDTLVK